jgi:hypothetical protein
MKTMIALSLLTAAGLLAQPPGPPPGRGFGAGRGFGGPRENMGHPVTGAPFSAVETVTETQVLPDGNTIQHTRTTNIWRDSMGRERLETTELRRGPNAQTGATAGTSFTHVTVFDPVGRVSREIDTQNKTVHEMVMRGPAAGQGQGRGPRPQFNRQAPTADPNMKNEELGTQVVNGESATGRRMTHTIPAGSQGNARQLQSVRETWMSPDLKVPVMTKITDPRRGTTVTQLTNINRSEPDATLFQIPAGYTVHSGPGRGGPGRGPRPNQNQNQN